jgi:hypothetical protein
MLVATSASAHVFDPQASFLHIRIGALGGNENSYHAGLSDAVANGKLTGAEGAERLVMKGMGMGLPFLFQVDAVEAGTQFFTGTPTIENLFFTVQNGSATFTWGTGKGTFQGDTVCTTACFGNANGLLGVIMVEVLGDVLVPIPVGVIGAGGKETVALGSASIAIEGAHWISGTQSITNIATNVFTITNGPRALATGVGFTLQATVNENTDLQAENGVTVVTVAGTTSFETTAETSGVNQVTLVSPVHINASTVTGNPPLPGMGLQVLRYVPEPGTMLLLGSAVAGLLVVGRKRMKR